MAINFMADKLVMYGLLLVVQVDLAGISEAFGLEVAADTTAV
jgi:hypothetical protein